MDAIRLALEAELAGDERVFLAGIDVGAGGNVFGLTRGLQDRFEERVRDTPISETAIVGLAVGAAMAGLRPVVELMYLDFLGVCFDQVLNQAAKIPFMTGGAADMALPCARSSARAAHRAASTRRASRCCWRTSRDSPSSCRPRRRTPTDCCAPPFRIPNPVVFIENRLLYSLKGPRPASDPSSPSAARRWCARAPT